MKRIFAALCFLVLAGCRANGQMPPQPPVYSCPTATVGGTAYTPLNAPANNTVAASITGTTFSTASLAPGGWCFIVQSWAIISPATTYQDSIPSNVAMVTTTGSLPVVELSWTPPAGAAGYTYIVSMAPATLVPAPLAPALSTPTPVAEVETPRAPVTAGSPAAPSSLTVQIASR